MAWFGKQKGHSKYYLAGAFQRARSSSLQSLQQGRFLDAEEELREAIRFGRDLVAVFPAARSDFAECLVVLANVLGRMNGTPEAEASLLEAAAVLRKLVEGDPVTYEPQLATVLRALAEVYRGPELYVDLAAPPVVGHENMRRLRRDRIAAGTWPLPTEFFSLDWISKAEQPLLELIELTRDLARKNPGQFLDQLAFALNLLGDMYVYTERELMAEPPLREALLLYKELARVDSQFREMLADTTVLLGRVETYSKDPS